MLLVLQVSLEQRNVLLLMYLSNQNLRANLVFRHLRRNPLCLVVEWEEWVVWVVWEVVCSRRLSFSPPF
jgi:hypothetical protein